MNRKPSPRTFERIYCHGDMLKDSVRLHAYRQALLEMVNPGDVVADIGAGSGILSFLAIQAGAEKVYAIEKDAIISEAESIASRNGMGDRIEFVKNRSDLVQLPQKVDLVVSELIGVFGLEENLLPYSIDARNRFLKEDGKLVPARIDLHIGPVQAFDLYAEKVDFWNQDLCGLDFSPVRESAVANRHIIRSSDGIEPLAPPETLVRMDFYKLERIPHIFEAKTCIQKPGVLHGLLGHFSSRLSPSVTLSTGPMEPDTHWGQAFFPMKEAVEVGPGDILSIAIKSIPCGWDRCWDWSTRIERDQKLVCAFEQSSFAYPLRELTIGRRDFRPALSEKGRIYRRVLDLCDGGMTIENIAQAILNEFPDHFPIKRRALPTVVSIVGPHVHV